MTSAATWIVMGIVVVAAAGAVTWVFWPEGGSPNGGLEDDDAAVPAQTKNQERGSIDVVATRQAWNDGQVRFSLSIDTHTVDLSNYDPLAKAHLEADGGALTPTADSEVVSNDGHHISAMLTFDAAADEPLTLILRDLDGITWRLEFTP